MMLKLYYFSLKKGTLCLALPRRHTDETVPLEQTLIVSRQHRRLDDAKRGSTDYQASGM